MSREEADWLVREFSSTDDSKYCLRKKIFKKKASEGTLQ